MGRQTAYIHSMRNVSVARAEDTAMNDHELLAGRRPLHVVDRPVFTCTKGHRRVKLASLRAAISFLPLGGQDYGWPLRNRRSLQSFNIDRGSL